MRWKDKIKRLVELLVATDDLRDVQNLTVDVQRVLYVHIAEARPAHPEDSSAFEFGLDNPSSVLPIAKSNQEP
jgi:hypothetical protein